MTFRLRRFSSFASLALLLGAESFAARAADWPQWQGLDRTAVSKETGLLKDWPKEGPPLAWQTKGLGGGYGTPSVAGGRIYGMGYRGDDEIVWALDEKKGDELWSVKIADKLTKGVGYGEGPRCTPTIDSDLLYAIGLDGDLVCLKVADGAKVWQKSLKKDFGGGRPGWGYSESPLVDGDKVVCTPGGMNTLVALDKKTGETVWKSAVPGADGAQYASAIAADVDGVRQYMQFVKGGVVGVNAKDGSFLWRYSAPANGTANCSTPIYHDGYVFAASAYGTGGGLAKLTKSSEGFKADEVYFTKKMKNHHGGMVLLDGYIYGSDEGQLACLDFKTGSVKWDARPPGKGSIAYADGRIYYRNEGGKLLLIEATPESYVEHGSFAQPDRSKHSAWPHPVVSNGKLYIRDQDVMFCYDVKQK